MFSDRRNLLRAILAATVLIFTPEASPLCAQTPGGTADAPNGPLAATPQKSVPTPVLLELFTSEGCSSCPPADELLSKLNGTIVPSGQQVIALSEHVTYWNHLGWTDPFSQQLFTDRQSNYSDKFGADEVYTPQVVVNGVRDANGSDRNAVLQAVRLEGLPLALQFHVLSLRPNGAGLTVIFSVDGKVPAAGAEIYAVIADESETRHVLRGENAGRTIMHVSVARSVGKSIVLHPGEQTIVSIPAPPPLKIQPEGPRSLILVAQLPGQGRVVGLATQPLDAPAGISDRQLARTGTLETR